MAQVSFDAVPADNQGGGIFSSVEFFTLRDDGDEAIVRILHDTTDSFRIFTVHENIMVGSKRRKVNCLRSPQDPIEMCPLCASGRNISNKIYINMLVYRPDQSGQIVVTPMVWERSFAYASKLKVLIDEYGPLSQSIFKIKRSGAAGSIDTTYDILYCNPKIYSDSVYPLTNMEQLESYTPLSNMILDKSAADMSVFLTTGSFPSAQPEGATPQPPMSYQPKADAAPPVNTPSYSATPPVLPEAPPAQPVYQQPQTQAPPMAAPQRWNATGAPTPPQAPPVAGGPGPRYY